MSILAWNCRGLGNWHTALALEKVVSSKDPSFIFLMETKLVISKMNGIRIMWRSTKNGRFSASSAYHSIREMGNNSGEDCSDGSGMKRVWNCIWNLNLPTKFGGFPGGSAVKL